MAIAVWLKQIGDAKSGDSVLHHGAIFTLDESDRHVGFMVLACRDHVVRIFGEEGWPVFELVFINDMTITPVERIDPLEQISVYVD